MDKQTQALKLALPDRRAVTDAGDPEDYINSGWNDCLAAIRKALAEQPAQQQEPVAWLHPANATCVTTDPTAYARGIPLYTSPQPSKPWVGLTDEERDAILNREFKQWWSRHDAVCRAIEAKLKEKNQ